MCLSQILWCRHHNRLFASRYALLGKPPPPYKTSLWKDGHWAFSLGHVDWVCNLISACNLIHVCNIHENVIIYTVLLLVSHKAPHKVYMVLCMPPPPHEAFPWQSDRYNFSLWVIYFEYVTLYGRYMLPCAYV